MVLDSGKKNPKRLQVQYLKGPVRHYWSLLLNNKSLFWGFFLDKDRWQAADCWRVNGSCREQQKGVNTWKVWKAFSWDDRN